jgi:dTDP-4-dehydrorhamnose reductase
VNLLVIGAAGQLGADLMLLAGGTATGLTRTDLDITDPISVDKAVESWVAGFAGPAGSSGRPVCVNAAAYTAVDAAEADRERAFAVNGAGPGYVAEACERYDVRLLHVSTDYVFDGTGTAPYAEDAPTGPTSVYGASKLAGERAVLRHPDCFVVRTAWVYGASGGNFVKTMIRLERARETLDVVDDQRGSPTWSRDLAAGLLALAASEARPGVYHCTNSGDTTWCGLARAIFEELGADPARVRPTTSAAYPRPAPRPAYSVLSDAAWLAAGLPALPDWRAALHTAFMEIPTSLRPE